MGTSLSDSVVWKHHSGGQRKSRVLSSGVSGRWLGGRKQRNDTYSNETPSKYDGQADSRPEGQRESGNRL